MRLTRMHVQDFWCIEDSNDFSIAEVTCLVGKNESGKTAILKALHKLNPEDKSKAEFKPSRDYPKRKWRPDVPIPGRPYALTTVWQLDESDLKAVVEVFGPGVVESPECRIMKSYSNQILVAASINDTAVLKNLIKDAQLGVEEQKPIAKVKETEEALRILNGLASRTAAQDKLLQSIQTKCPKGAEAAVINAIADRLPTFLYFDEYLTLPGTVSVNELVARKTGNILEDRDKVFLALLSLAGTTLDKVQQSPTFEDLNASLRAVSNQITSEIFKYWSQNKYLDVEMRLDHARPNDPPPFNQGWVFRTRIHNRRHRADTSFDERSRGFVWFFSFLVWFQQLKQNYGDNLVILLDEPGLTLHARAQGDLLRYINEQLRPKYRVLYSTHSPFMIDPDNLLSARTVEDVVQKHATTGEEVLLGTKVGEKVLSTDPDTVSPLQRALDYEMTQTLFIGRHTVLVEGASDFLYLKWFSQQLQRAGKPGLDYRWTISNVSGVDRIPGFVSLFRGNNLDIAAIADIQAGAKQRVENARKALKEGRLLTLDKYAGQNEADIEDVLGRVFYLALVTKALDLRAPHELPSERPAGAPERIAKEVDVFASALPANYREFNHFVPADYLFQHGDEGASLAGFEAALERMERLVNDLNAILS